MSFFIYAILFLLLGLVLDIRRMDRKIDGIVRRLEDK